MNDRIKFAATVIAVGVLTAASACGGSPTVTNAPAPGVGIQAPASTPTAVPASTPAPVNAVGGRLTATDLQGATYKVTVSKIVDPAQSSNQYIAPANGTRFVAVQVTLVGVSGNVQNNANNNTHVIGTDSQIYTATFGQTTAGTNFNSGSFVLTPGQQLVGVVIFQIPNNIQVATVEWIPDSGFSNNVLRWNV